jgi:hypothetical protein
MSEFSDSYHPVANVEGAVALVRRAGRNAVVLPEQPPYTCVLVDQPEGGTDPQLLAANEGWLVRYYYAEDHGVWIDLYDHAKKVGRIVLEWGPDFLGEGLPRARFDAAPWLAARLLDDERAAKLKRLGDGMRQEVVDPAIGYEVARLLGLTRFESLACDPTSVKRGPWDRVVERAHARFPDAATVIEVDPRAF